MRSKNGKVSIAEKRYLEKQAEIEKRKVRLIASGRGRKAEMISAEGCVF
ncbi:hypothetical protein VB735_29295 [Halotia wernerae UHCC 0503]|nr:hypothetical protein [Halotia wernerae UHCC 0503]